VRGRRIRTTSASPRLTTHHSSLNAGLVAVVVDGMGGVQLGRRSAQVAKRAFLRAYAAKSERESVAEALHRSVHEANDAVLKVGEARQDARAVGATLTAAAVHDNRLSWVSVGDTALYLLRRTEIRRLNKAHTTEDEVGAAVSSFLGLQRLVEIDRSVEALELETGDRVLVCTDGLYRALSDSLIAQVLEAAETDRAAEALTAAAIRARAPDQDNVTAAVIACVGPTEPRPLVVPSRRWMGRPASERRLPPDAPGRTAGAGGRLRRWTARNRAGHRVRGRDRSDLGSSKSARAFLSEPVRAPLSRVPPRSPAPAIGEEEHRERCQLLADAMRVFQAPVQDVVVTRKLQVIDAWQKELGCRRSDAAAGADKEAPGPGQPANPPQAPKPPLAGSTTK